MNTYESKMKNPVQNMGVGTEIEIVRDIPPFLAQDMKNKYELHCCGSGGSMPTDVEEIESVNCLEKPTFKVYKV